MSVSLSATAVQVLLLDIEGTTTPVEFVYGVLFPFARERVRSYLDETLASDSDIAAAVRLLREEHASDVAGGQTPPEWRDDPAGATLDSVTAYVHWLMDRDRKSRGLKVLQGKIWEQGYRSGALRGEVYPDVPRALQRWTAGGMSVGIFSSGSVLAQKLLFAHSTAGDLTSFLRWYFDTSVGSKAEAASYRRIAAEVSSDPDRILFLSDAGTELEAARSASLQTLLCVRPPAQRPADADRYLVVHTLDEIVV